MNLKLFLSLPNCYKCLYFVEHPKHFEDLAICLKYKKGYMNDKLIYEYERAEACRKDEKKCGINGISYKPLDP
jgi:hypothetical protein